MIPYSCQSITQEDIDAVNEVLKSPFLTQGDAVPTFEQALCEYTGAHHAVAVNSGTSALHIACLALGLQADDYLWTSPISFVASANCGLFCGAKIDFVDINSDSWNIDVQLLEEKLEMAATQGRLPKILVVVHFAGLPADMDKIHQLSLKYQFRIIEDACHALGATYQGRAVGNCAYSDITVFSFHPVKSITTGEGGAAITNDLQLAQYMKMLASHGITRNNELMTHEPDGGWYYQQKALGYNYRLSDIHAALGVSQLKRLDDFINKRKKIAESYDNVLSGTLFQKPLRLQDRQSSFHLYVVLIPKTMNRRRVFDRLRQAGIGVNVHYVPIHLQPYFASQGFDEGDFPLAESYYARAISLPCYPLLTEEKQHYVTECLEKIINEEDCN